MISWLMAALVAAALALIAASPATATTCGCTLTGPYVASASASLSSNGGGTFSLLATSSGGTTTVSVKRVSNGQTMLSQGFTGSGSYGFGPGARTFGIVSFSGASHTARAWSLTGASGQLIWSVTGNGTASLGFSPPGQYLLYAAAAGSTTNLRVVSTSNGALAFQTSFTPAPSATWGFGPDGEALLYSSGTPVTWKLVNLLNGSTVKTVNLGSAGAWRFSPCGDVVGVLQVPSGQVSATLYSVRTGATVGGKTVGSTSGGSLSATATQHVLTAVSSTYNLAANAAATNCVVLSPSSAATGSKVSVTSSGLAAGEAVVVRFNGSQVATGTAPNGAYTGSFVVPNVAPGNYSVTVAGQTSGRQFAQTLTVTTTPPVTSASYDVSATPTSWIATTSRTYNIAVTNTGNQLWTAGGTNPVRLGVHFANQGGGYGSNTWYTDQRFDLKADIAPQGSATIQVTVSSPENTGNMVLEAQMVKEGRFWFGQYADANVAVGAPPTPVNLALNSSGTGLPSPLESDPGWGGGAQPWDIVDGARTYADWARGLAFTGGDRSWGVQPCGVRQATVNLGSAKSFDRVVLWHHGDSHVPATAQVSYWDGTTWRAVSSTRTFGAVREGGAGSVSDEYRFSAVSASKVRWSFDNCQPQMFPGGDYHGWLYEFEVWSPGAS